MRATRLLSHLGWLFAVPAALSGCTFTQPPLEVELGSSAGQFEMARKCIESAGTSSTVTEKARDFDIALIGHAYGNHQGLNQGLYEPLLQSELLKRELFLLGDNVRGGSLQEYQQVEFELRDTQKTLIIGNHDNRDIVSEVFNASFGSKRYENHLVLWFDTTVSSGQLKDEQLFLLNKALSETQNLQSVIILVHHLIFQDPQRDLYLGNSHWGEAGNPSYQSELWELLEATGIPTFVIAGDTGAFAGLPYLYCRKPSENMTFIATGVGGGELDNVVLVDFEGDGVRFRVCLLNQIAQGIC